MPRIVTLALCALVFGCQKDAGIVTNPGASPLVRLAVRAQVTAPSGSSLDIRVVYFDKAGAQDTAVVLTDSVFALTGGPQSLALQVNLTPCLNDTTRVNPTTTGCAIALVARLLKSGVTTDSMILAPVVAAPGGTLQEPMAVALSGAKMWVGGAAAAPSDWSTAANWSPASVPVAGSRVLIQAGAAHMPVLSSNVTVDTIVLNGNGTDLTVNGHHLTVTGLLQVSGGTLTMTNSADTVTAGVVSLQNNLSTGSANGQGHLTAGVLEVGGKFFGQPVTFEPSGTFQVVATGSGVWSVDTIPTLTVTGPGTTITTQAATGLSGPVTFGTLTLTNGASVAAYAGITPQFTVLSAIKSAAGTNFAPGIVTLRSATALDSVNGHYGALTTIYEGPIGININPKFTYQQLVFRGGATAAFVGATTFSGPTAQLWVDSASSVSINAQTVNFTGTSAADTAIKTTNGGVVTSLLGNEKVNIPVGQVVFLGGSEHGQLNAGVWTVGNGFSGNAVSGTGTFQLVVVGGTSASPALIFADTLPNVTLTNNAFADIVGLSGATQFPTVINNLTLTNGATLGSFATSTQVTLIGSFTGAAGTQVASGTFTILTPTGLTSAGTFSPSAVYFHPTTPALTLPGGLSPAGLWIRGSAQAKLSASISPGTLYIDSTSNLDLNGHTVNAGAGGVVTQNGGTITMAAASDTLNAGGGAFFMGGNETGLLAAGVFNVGAGTLSPNSATAFVPSGTLQTVCGSPTAGGALLYGQFQSLQVVNRCKVEATTLAGSFIALPGGSGAAPVLAPAPFGVGPLTATSLNVTALVDSNVPLILTGIVTAFQNVTFEGFSPTQTQLTMTLAPGTVVTLTNVTFQALLATDTGSYLNVTNSGGVAGGPVTINVSHDPGNGAAKTLTTGNVTVNWSP
jgi:hypothetical protein